MRCSHDIGWRQRLIVALLLAFCIDTLRPAVRPAAHHHAGDELPHVHVGDVANEPGAGHSLLFGAGVTRPAVPTQGRRAFAAASPTDLHVHLIRPLQVAHVAPLAPAPGIRRYFPTHTPAYDGERAATTRAGRARSPPLLSA